LAVSTQTDHVEVERHLASRNGVGARHLHAFRIQAYRSIDATSRYATHPLKTVQRYNDAKQCSDAMMQWCNGALPSSR
jgi:hypothetical protein